jgi:tannase/feruloyl esterase
MTRVVFGIAIGLALLCAPPAHAASCEDLAKLALPNTTITSATLVPAGTFVPPPPSPPGSQNPKVHAQPAVPDTYKSVPAFCRVSATLKPSKDSNIGVEVWLPVSAWNGRFQGVGNGGWAGTIDYAGLARAVRAGYAGASTDTGHVGNTAAFAVGHPEKLIDMGYRSVHEMTVQGKSIVSAFYGRAPSVSIFNGCSQGGRQAVTEADRFPNDYDGIIAGAPALYNMVIHTARVALNAAAQRTPDSRVPPEKYAMVHDAVLRACDALDGVKDSVIDDPLQCNFDPSVLECKNGDAPSCLTPAQVETVRLLYSPLKKASGEVYSSPLLQPGTELGWSTLAGTQPVDTAFEAFKYVVFKNPNWTVRQFNPATDIDRGLRADEGILSLTDPNLQAYFNHGGKLMLYHGWQDPQVPAQNTVRFFNDVVKTMGPPVVAKSIQLYMVPGMNHCSGGPGPFVFDKVAAIDEWLKTGTAPKQIIASYDTSGTTDRTRPLCPYGQVAHWKGSGSIDDAANFTCVASQSDKQSLR